MPRVVCTCDGSSCEVHSVCNNCLVVEAYKLFPLDDCMFCTKACYQRFEHDTKSTHLTWETNSKDGRMDQNTSAHLLVNWLTNIDNYTQWRGGSNTQNTSGIKKIEIATCICQMINDNRVCVQCMPQMVHCKIEDNENQMRLAFDWITSKTGAGI